MIGNCYLVKMNKGKYPLLLFGSLSDIDLYETKENKLNIEKECKVRKAMIVDHGKEWPGYYPYKGDLESVYFYDSSNNKVVKYRDYLTTSDILVFDFDSFIVLAKEETNTASFREWAGDDLVTLAIVFTDIVGSTAMGEELRDEAMSEVRKMHFAQSRRLIEQFKGKEIKTIGDSFMAAFKSVVAALDYALALSENTGHPQVRIRVGIHIGQMEVEEGDVVGGTVNFAARVVSEISGAEIWLSDRAKEDIDRLGAARQTQLDWKLHQGVGMKGFRGKFDLWSIKTSISDSVGSGGDGEGGNKCDDVATEDGAIGFPSVRGHVQLLLGIAGDLADLLDPNAPPHGGFKPILSSPVLK